MTKNLLRLLSNSLSPDELLNVYGSYDVVGDIVIVRLKSTSEKAAQRIAEEVTKIHKNVKTVLAQTGPMEGDFRLRSLIFLAGENRTRTVYREDGCVFTVDLNKCYFSPRLSHERWRIANLVQSGETVVNMFAGVGCFSVIIAKHVRSAKVYSIDINPLAVRFMTDNIRLNRVYGKVIPILGDSKSIIETKLKNCADRILMPLPKLAFEYLPHAVSVLKPSGGWIHYYDFEHAGKKEDPIEKVKIRVGRKLTSLNIAFKIPFSRIVRTVGPNWHQVVLDIRASGEPEKS